MSPILIVGLIVVALAAIIGVILVFASGNAKQSDIDEAKMWGAVAVGFTLVCFFAWLFWGHWHSVLSVLHIHATLDNVQMFGLSVTWCILVLVFIAAISGIIFKNRHNLKRHKQIAVVVVGLAIFGLSVWVFSGSGKPPGGFYKFDEYDAAKHFIQTQYPGAQTFSSCDDSTVEASPGGDCRVVVAVSGVNAFNAPIRDTMTVIMQFQNGRFGLTRIESQNEFNLVQQEIKDGH